MAKSAETASNSWNEAPAIISAGPVDLGELTFGQYLRRERVLRNISKEEVLRVTKVSAQYYDALEGNQFDRLPPRAFVVGFLRVFSGHAGLDPDTLVNRYLTAVADKEAFEEVRQPRRSFFRRHLSKFLLLGGLLILGFLMAAPLLR